jgi:hypothetical protein
MFDNPPRQFGVQLLGTSASLRDGKGLLHLPLAEFSCY